MITLARLTKENAPSVVAVQGVQKIAHSNNSQGQHTQKPSRSAMSMFADPRHKAVCRSLGYVLTLDTVEAWSSLQTVIQARLTVSNRGAMAIVALRSLDTDDALDVIDLFTNGIGMPDAPFLSFMDQAAFWADMAEPAELDAYALASFRAMRPERQQDFLFYVNRGATA